MATSLEEGVIEKVIHPIPSITHVTNGKWIHQRVSYVIGGVTVTYPVGLFSSPPIVTVGIELQNLVYAVDLIVNPIITSNTTTSVTIRVNKEILTVLTEALTNDVYLNVFAIL